MATRKRTSSRSSRSGLVGRAVSAGRNALREAESRVPPDIRRQLERTVKEGQKTLKTAIDQLQAQVRSRAKQADVDRALKRLENLSKQVQQMARAASSRGTTSSTARRAKSATTKRTARSTTRKASTRKAATPKPATRKASASTSAPRRTAPRRPSTRRATSAPAEPISSPATSEPTWMPESNDSGETPG